MKKKIIKIVKTSRIILTVLLSSCLTMALYAQPYLAPHKPDMQQKTQFDNFTETSLQDNPFRWDPEYLQTLQNQKLMTLQSIPHINRYLNGMNSNSSPRIHLKCNIDNQSTSFVDILLELGYGALEYWYDRWQWSASPIFPPACEGSSFDTQFIHCPLR